MKKSNNFFNDIKEVEAYLLANVSYGKSPDMGPKSSFESKAMS